LNLDGHEALYIITYDDVTEHSVSSSEVLCLESCRMFLQTVVFRDLNIVLYFVSTFIFIQHRNFLTMWSVYCLSLYSYNVFIFKIEVQMVTQRPEPLTI